MITIWLKTPSPTIITKGISAGKSNIVTVVLSEMNPGADGARELYSDVTRCLIGDQCGSYFSLCRKA